MDPLLVSASQSQTQNGSSTADVERRSADFSPSVWGEYFLAYAYETADIEADKRVEEVKEEVKRVLLSSPPSQRLDLIDYIQRLGVSHHFEDEIHQLLQQIHNQYSSSSSDDDDLHTVALRFRLLRQEGFKVSCDMFNKFIDVDGNLKESCVADVPGLLSLYETAHLRKHGEDFLDRAVSFTTTHLESAVAAPGRLSPPLSNQVAHALYQPLWKGNPRIEMQCQVRMYLKEAKWYHLKCTPKTYDEYMRVALITSGMFLVEAAFIVPLAGEISTRDSLESLFRDPDNIIVRASNTLGRLLNDIRSRKVQIHYEQKRGNDITAIECYMKEYCVTEEEAFVELNKQVNDAWKDVNEELLQPPPTVPRPILLLCLNLLRVTDVIYKYDDGYTNGGVVLKDYITSLLVEPAPM
uniref:(-)-germacrene D synthase-like n=1 Tax=Fragaria vesca subsp. vesca TaxID=101020 RepID=UPI0005CB34A4|nr:PREDICTED: (-)-germacrene D synthase-like [Fragaria vesca subsp. vesca]